MPSGTILTCRLGLQTIFSNRTFQTLIWFTNGGRRLDSPCGTWLLLTTGRSLWTVVSWLAFIVITRRHRRLSHIFILPFGIIPVPCRCILTITLSCSTCGKSTGTWWTRYRHCCALKTIVTCDTCIRSIRECGIT